MSSSVRAVQDKPQARGCGVIVAKRAAAFKWTEAHDEAFPDIPHCQIPFGNQILVQLRRPPSKVGSLILSEETKATEQSRTQIGVIRAVGPLAFCNQETMKEWPEGAWAEPGDFVRIPLYGGDRAYVDAPSGEPVVFVLIKDLHLVAGVVGDPLTIKAYVAGGSNA